MNKYLRAISFNLLFFAISVIFFIVITPLAIKVMGEELFGLWSILSALILFSSVGTLGIGAIVMKFSSEAAPNGDFESQARRVMTAGFMIVGFMAILSALILLSIRTTIVENIDTSAETGQQFGLSISIIAAGILPQFLSRVPHGFLLSRLHNREARQLELLSSILLWVGAVALAWMKRDLVSIATWCVLSNLLILFLYLKTTHRILPLRIQFDMLTLRKMLNFSGYMFVENIAIASFQQMDKVLAGITLGPALAGVYSIGTSLALRLSIFTGQATEVMIPYASLKDSMDDHERLYMVFRRLSRYVSLMLAGVSSIFIIWMEEIISIWISPDFAARYADTFSLLIIAYSLLSLSRPAHQTLTGLGQVKFTSMIYLLSTVLVLTGLFFLSRQFGLEGAVASNLLILSLLLFNLYVYRALQRPMRWSHMLIDMQWGLFLPALVYGATLFVFQSSIAYKVIATFLLGMGLAFVLYQDASVKDRLLQVMHLAPKPKV